VAPYLLSLTRGLGDLGRARLCPHNTRSGEGLEPRIHVALVSGYGTPVVHNRLVKIEVYLVAIRPNEGVDVGPRQGVRFKPTLRVIILRSVPAGMNCFDSVLVRVLVFLRQPPGVSRVWTYPKSYRTTC